VNRTFYKLALAVAVTMTIAGCDGGSSGTNQYDRAR
jgi:hypothetical protein